MERLTVKRMREELLPVMVKDQGGKCPMCGIDLRHIASSNVCVDHNHRTGVIRGALCRNCNGMSGKVENLAIRSKKDLTELQWLKNVVKYLEGSQVQRYQFLHPTHRTLVEKLAKRNLQARLRRAKKKEV